MPTGSCKLCLQSSELQDSHVFPKGLYKRFIADNARGGSLLDLKNLCEHSKQFTEYWLCEGCEERLNKGGETYFFGLLNRGRQIRDYDPRLYYFAVSVSWRSALAHFELHAGLEHVSIAVESWRRFLLGEILTAEPYSQYLAALDGAKWEHWNGSVGGIAIPNLHHVFSAIGPFIVLGVTQPEGFTEEERAILAPARLEPRGGTIRLDEQTTDAILAIKPARTACNFWQTVAKQKLAELAEKLVCSVCGHTVASCSC